MKIIGWIYNDKIKFENIAGHGDYVEGAMICVLKRKKDLGKYKGKKVKITIEEI